MLEVQDIGGKMVNLDMTAQEILKEAKKHKELWYFRNLKFADWYRLLILDNSDLYQEDMEIVISNDPKTFYKKAVRLLSSSVSTSIPTDVLVRPEQIDVQPVVKFLESEWRLKDTLYRRRGRQPWMTEFVSFLLATGWFDVLVYANQSDGLVAEARNPAEGYPMYADDGLRSYCHIYTVPYYEANEKCDRNNWRLDRRFQSGNVIITDYWVRDSGLVYNAIVMNTQLVKPVTVMPGMSEMPVLVGPVGGMPDRGSLLPNVYDKDLSWQGKIGESIVADNEEVYRNYNKNLSYTQQIIRDVSQSRWYEKSESDTAILNPDTIYKRGAIFRMGINEDIGPLPVPPLPVELSTHARAIEDMIQKGSFPWSMYGGMVGGITSYMMSQISASAQDILAPYVEAGKFVLSEIDNIWLRTMREYQLNIRGWQIPEMFPEVLEVKVDMAVKVPGDLVQRATLSRMISPNFEVSPETSMYLLWPEIKDPKREQGNVNAARALQHPVAVSISLISNFRRMADTLMEVGDVGGAELFEKAANAVESTITALVGGAQPPPQAITPRPEVMPRERTAPEELLT